MVVVHSRSDWTSRPGKGCASMPTAGVRGVVYHWPGSAGSLLGLTVAQVTSRLRGWQDDHMRPKSQGGREFCDIAYQWAAADIGGVPHVFPLRTFDRRSAGQDNPNRAGNENAEWYAVLVVIGQADTRVPPALMEGMRWCRGKALGRTPDSVRVVGHSFFGDTTCPGDAVRASLPLVTTTQEDDMPLTDDDITRIAGAVWARQLADSAGNRAAAGDRLVAVDKRTAAIARDAGLILAKEPADVDEVALATALGPLLAPHLPAVIADLDDDTVAAIARAAADEQDTRDRKRLGL